jgi:formiminoglutamase
MPEPDMSLWSGRVDAADGPRAQRWHQRVRPLTPGCQPGVVLVGFACDEGVRRNGGRVGATGGPLAIRKALGNLAWHHEQPVYDAGEVRCNDGDMEAAQSRLTEVVANAITAGHRPLVLGGGHEASWGTFRGVVSAHPDATVGVINLDAHFDLRADPVANSGTPFHQIADFCTQHGRPFRYLCLGVAEPANTPALFDRADELGVVWYRDFDLPPWEMKPIHAVVADFVRGVDLVHLSIDLDVLPAAVMPAVSAPAACGVPLEAVEPLVGRVLAAGRTAAVDLVELNPAYDQDGRGAKVAARLAWLVAERWATGGTS